MTIYYFDNNKESILTRFALEGIRLTEEKKEYVFELADYLKTEYNTPFSDFLNIVTCRDIDEAFLHEYTPREFVDEIMMQYNLFRQSAYVTWLMSKQHILN